MKTTFILLFVCLSIASVLSHVCTYEEFKHFQKVHNKVYVDQTEENQRFNHFCNTISRNERLNYEYPTATFGITQFADLSPEEFTAQYLMPSLGEPDLDLAPELKTSTLLSPPQSFDWRNNTPPVVTAVYNQGSCGSCWAFSATENIESVWALSGNDLVSLSMQQVVDCDTQAEGCNGGWPYLAVEYAAKNGLELESDYPYTAEDGDCQYNKNKAVKVAGGYQFVTANSTDSLKAALVNGPVSVAIEADQDVFQFYSKGVISTGCGAELDHAVLAVGYQKVGVLEAFIVKNSWGSSWGQDGYVYISTINKLNKNQGACGILAQPVIPTA